MKKLKKSTAFIISMVMMLILSTSCAAVSGKPDTKEAVKTSAEFAREMGIGWNLGNTMEAYWSGDNEITGAQKIGENKPQNYETCWGAVVTTKECIDGIKKAGFSTVRIPVYWGNMMGDKFKISDEYFDRVEEIINYCLDNDLYVVINIHHYDGFILEHYSKKNALKIVSSLWKQIAKRYKDYSDRLIFEGFNESLGNHREEDNFSEDEIYEYVNELNQTFVDAVRKMGGNNSNRMLIVSGYWTNIDRTTDKRFKIPEDTAEDRIMVSVHYVDNAIYWQNQIGGNYWWEYEKSQCELLKKAFSDKGIQVFLGECTSGYPQDRLAGEAKKKSSAELMKKRMELELEYGFIPILWDVNDGFYSRDLCKIKDKDAEAAIKELSDACKSR